MFKFKNLSEVKTTIAGIVTALFFLAGVFWPDKIKDVNGEEVVTYVDSILEGIAGLIAVFTLIFGSKDG